MGIKIFDINPDQMENGLDGVIAKEVDIDGNPVQQEQEHHVEEESRGVKFAIRPVSSHSVGRIEFPMEAINEINEHIDNVIIPKHDDFSQGLIGQLKNDKRSSQLNFPFDDDVGKQLKILFNQIGNTFLGRGYQRQSKTDCYQCWTNHAYAGDYNPLHDHGVQTMAGLSGFLWLKVPECIEKLDGENISLNSASGGMDGFTHLVWGTNTRKDILRLHPNTEEAVKPEVGTMLVFPNWLKHAVFPFYGEGERRSMAMNWNVYETEEELKSWMTDRESSIYDESKKNED